MVVFYCNLAPKTVASFMKWLAKLSIKKPIRSHKETQNMTDKVLLIRVQPFPMRNILINLLGSPKTGYSSIFPRS